jgi:N-acetylneuraminate synthase/N,N'-diacetyllegionaminate synthase
MSTLGDVDISLSALREGGAEKITLLHCTTSYPCPYDSVNLNAMRTLREAFHYPVGYSDHTIGAEVPFAAVALGASVLEKHFTLDRSMEGPDHAASMEPGDFQKMVQGIRHIEVCLGDGVKVPTEEEQEISKVVTKRIVAVREIKKNEVFSVQDIAIKRNAQGLPARYWDMVIGSHAVRDYAVDEGIGWR